MLKKKRESGVRVDTIIKVTTIQTIILLGIYLFIK